MAEGDPPPKDAAEETGLEEEDLFEDFALTNGAGASWFRLCSIFKLARQLAWLPGPSVTSGALAPSIGLLLFKSGLGSLRLPLQRPCSCRCDERLPCGLSAHGGIKPK